ncbi:glycosyltransferase family 2 protein [Lachnospiraceae bacterium OttesenSCG-928-J05]|nr:glycosyltransferase family 2 protein [Lachnospiraceae bacterium OttesenSCG-928-J05]
MYDGKDLNMLISQCMIVKNEEKNIERALTWAKDIVSEQIVVDTGSTDKTVEIAKSLGATVFEIPWENDFAKAKNFAIDKAKGQWIIFFDADEYLQTQAEAHNLKKLLPSVSREFVAISSPLINLDDNHDPISKISQVRVFRNQDKLRYAGLIHENLSTSDNSKVKGLHVDNCFTIMHTGYSASERKDKDKGRRNTEMLKKLVQDKPSDYNAKVYFVTDALRYGFVAELDPILSAIFEPVNYKTILPSLRIYLETCLLQEFTDSPLPDSEERLLQIYHTGMSWNASHPDYDFLLGNWYRKQEDLAKAKSYFARAYDKLLTYDGILPIVLPSNMEGLCLILLTLCKQEKDAPGVVKYAIATLKINRYHTKTLMILLELLRREIQDDNSALKVLNILSSIYDFSNYKDRILVFTCIESVGISPLEKAFRYRMTKEDFTLLNNIH